jgi:hypothetical protein
MAKRSLVLDTFSDLTAGSQNIVIGKRLSRAYIWESATPGVEDTPTHLRFYTNLPVGAGYRVAMRFTSLVGPPGEQEEYELPPVMVDITATYMEINKENVRPLFNAQYIGFYLVGPDGNQLQGNYTYWPAPPRASYGYWQSKLFKLSDFLVRVEDIEIKLRWALIFTEVIKWSTGFGFGWTCELGLAKSEVGDITWYTSIPTSNDIAVNNYTHGCLRITFSNTLYDVDTVFILLEEEYATASPTEQTRLGKANLYVPKLRVVINNIDFSEYTSSFSGKSLTLVVPSGRYSSVLSLGSQVRIELDDAVVMVGTLSRLSIEPYANGNLITLDLESAVDILNRNEDIEVVVTPDGQAKQLPFADDLGYITHVIGTLTPGVRPFIEDKSVIWRPMTVWKQNPDTNAGEAKLVNLDTDYDWLQLYAIRNQSVRSKIDAVAQANGFTLKSYGGMPYLVHLAPYPNVGSLENLPAIRLHSDAEGNFLPDLRFGVPVFNTGEVPPRELRLEGLSSSITASPTGSTQVNVWFLDSNGNPTTEARAGSNFPVVEVPLVDSSGNAAVYKNLEVRLFEARNIDLNLFANPYATYELVYGTVNGYYGVTKIRLIVYTPPFAYYEVVAKAKGELVYSASGGRADAPQWLATGAHVPLWARMQDKNIVGELLAYGKRLFGNKENIKNEFVPQYSIPGNADSFTIEGYTVYSNYAERIIDAIALRKALEWITAQMEVVGYSGLLANQVVAIPRLPEGGVGARIEVWDYYLVLEEPSLSFQAGGQVRSTVQLGYMGTLTETLHTTIIYNVDPYGQPYEDIIYWVSADGMYDPFGRTWSVRDDSEDWLLGG